MMHNNHKLEKEIKKKSHTFRSQRKYWTVTWYSLQIRDKEYKKSTKTTRNGFNYFNKVWMKWIFINSKYSLHSTIGLCSLYHFNQYINQTMKNSNRPFLEAVLTTFGQRSTSKYNESSIPIKCCWINLKNVEIYFIFLLSICYWFG